MKKYYVYILKCADDSYYVGISNNLNRRLEEHQNAKNNRAYTAKRLPVVLVFQQEFLEVKQAIAFEKQLKGWNRKKKEALIKGRLDLLSILAKCMNETSHENYDGNQ